MMKHEWSIEAVRACVACEGTGRRPASLPASAQDPATLAPRSIECLTCGGAGEERKRFTLVDLAAELRTL